MNASYAQDADSSTHHTPHLLIRFSFQQDYSPKGYQTKTNLPTVHAITEFLVPSYCLDELAQKLEAIAGGLSLSELLTPILFPQSFVSHLKNTFHQSVSSHLREDIPRLEILRAHPRDANWEDTIVEHQLIFEASHLRGATFTQSFAHTTLSSLIEQIHTRLQSLFPTVLRLTPFHGHAYSHHQGLHELSQEAASELFSMGNSLNEQHLLSHTTPCAPKKVSTSL